MLLENAYQELWLHAHECKHNVSFLCDECTIDFLSPQTSNKKTIMNPNIPEEITHSEELVIPYPDLKPDDVGNDIEWAEMQMKIELEDQAWEQKHKNLDPDFDPNDDINNAEWAELQMQLEL